MAPKIDISIKKQVIRLYGENVSIRKIAETLKISKSVVGRLVKEYKECGHVPPSKKLGRPRKTSAREDRLTRRTSLRDRFKSAESISRAVSDSHGVKVSRKTVGRRLVEIGLFARTPMNKPLISKKNQKLRVAFANEHALWTAEKCLL